MTDLITIAIPIGAHHTHIAQQAIASAQRQTLPVTIATYHDVSGHGPAWTRNQLLTQVKTPFITFLDADDVLDPEFAERCIRRYVQSGGGVYVYTDWVGGERVIATPERFSMFEEGMVHLMTVLLPTKLTQIAGGFDETLPTLEDADLFYRLHLMGLCGVREPVALVTYRREFGKSALNAHTQPEDQRHQTERDMMAHFRQRYGVNTMCACGSNKQQQAPLNAQGQQAGDIQARAMYTPAFKVSPNNPRRKYPRAGHGEIIWVDPRDAAMRPDMWQPVARVEELAPDVETVAALAQQAFGQAS